MSASSRIASLEASKISDEQTISSLKDGLAAFQAQMTSLNAKMDVIVDLDTKLLAKR